MRVGIYPIVMRVEIYPILAKLCSVPLRSGVYRRLW